MHGHLGMSSSSTWETQTAAKCAPHVIEQLLRQLTPQEALPRFKCRAGSSETQRFEDYSRELLEVLHDDQLVRTAITRFVKHVRDLDSTRAIKSADPRLTIPALHAAESPLAAPTALRDALITALDIAEERNSSILTVPESVSVFHCTDARQAVFGARPEHGPGQPTPGTYAAVSCSSDDADLWLTWAKESCQCQWPTRILVLVHRIPSETVLEPPCVRLFDAAQPPEWAPILVINDQSIAVDGLRTGDLTAALSAAHIEHALPNFLLSAPRRMRTDPSVQETHTGSDRVQSLFLHRSGTDIIASRDALLLGAVPDVTLRLIRQDHQLHQASLLELPCGSAVTLQGRHDAHRREVRTAPDPTLNG